LEQPSGAFPVPNSTLPFHQCEAEQPELMFFTEGNFSWAHPQDIFRDEDAAAQNPYYADLSRGYRNVLDSLAIEVEKHAAMQRLSYDRDDIKAEISDILTSVPLCASWHLWCWIASAESPVRGVVRLVGQKPLQIDQETLDIRTRVH
jgi:hypothetical protein